MTTTEATATHRTWKGHGRPSELIWLGSIANRGEANGILATVAIEDGQLIIREKATGGVIDRCGPSGKFWAIPA